MAFLQRVTAERTPGLAILPILATGVFYALPPSIQAHTLFQFIPQALAYVALVTWACQNPAPLRALGLDLVGASRGLTWGGAVGLILGLINTGVILWVVPWLGQDIQFLTTTPHAKVPFVVMIPWFVGGIAMFVELNFRGFLVGRLLALGTQSHIPLWQKHSSMLAIGISALTFSFDPFMVATFRHLHWMAIWDGLIWGYLWVRWRNLYMTITAHAVEVMILYTCMKATLE